MPAPILETSRLTLRPHVLSDIDPFWEFFQSDRATYVGAPKTRTHMWYGLASEVGSWDMMGHGGWGVDLKDGTFVGQVAITQPPHFPEREIGWTFFAGAEGKGYAAEAASAALTWAWDQGFDTLVSYIHPGKARSIALAKRLGGQHDAQADLPTGETSAETLVFRHSPDADGSPEAYA
ncbi:GNAT family N-acetyltransferase [Primorskyibacter sp. 2E233]|uniref:GNAT family N-acetyltransferase n=1 Tax=Primorskyibacter sp. 2E233 TaxID=3413431 RepID=UPI003BF139CB